MRIPDGDLREASLRERIGSGVEVGFSPKAEGARFDEGRRRGTGLGDERDNGLGKIEGGKVEKRLFVGPW